MFIPTGKILHENLATSYVLVDRLVADLCDGGFSGVVEVVLRETEAYVVITGGDVASVIETHDAQKRNVGGVAGKRITVAEVAERSRRERGRVSVYAYSAEKAKAVAGRINAQTLYVGLSTEFTDLTRMMRKLAREKDREWFIEINSESGLAALIHMTDSCCRIINSNQDAPEAESDVVDLSGNTVLGGLLDECNRTGGTFDVYFQRTPEAGKAAAQTAVLEMGDTRPTDARVETMAANLERDESAPLLPIEVFANPRRAAEPLMSADSPLRDRHPAQPAEGYDTVVSAAADKMSFEPLTGSPPPRPRDVVTSSSPFAELIEAPLPIDAGGFAVSSDDEAMGEVKRLVGEIARTIEEAVQLAGHHDAFSMALRAGQLEIAERYPFLDPFAGEFEYLAGEIVFVGHATPERFIAGLTEALKFAVQTVMQSSAYADRLRAFVTEDLQKLSASNRSQYERFGLEQAIEQIIAAQRPH